MNNWYNWAKKNTVSLAAEGKPEAFAGIRVLDLSCGNIGGCVVSSVLAEFGADVIKIEPPEGDTARLYSPEAIYINNTGLGFLTEGHNKRYITLNLKNEKGRDIFKSLAEKSDVIIETAKAGEMDSLGIGYRQLSEINTGLIYLALSTYGHFGNKSSYNISDSDIVNQALSGVVYISGEPEEEKEAEEYQVPTKMGNWHGWYSEGLWGAFGVILALNFREVSGKGQFVDIAGSEAVMKFIDYNLTWFHTAGMVRERLGNLDGAAFPYTYVKCKDGFTFLAAYNDDAFESLMEIIGKKELIKTDSRLSSFKSRTIIENEKYIHSLLEEWAVNYTADEILEIIQDYTSKKKGPGAAVVTGRVNTPLETLSEKNWHERECFRKIITEDYGELTVSASPWKMSKTPPRIKWGCKKPGADNEAVYAEILGLRRETISELANDGVL